MKQFLNCIENGLGSNYKIDPPFWENIVDSTNFSIVLKINEPFDQNIEEENLGLNTYHPSHSSNYFELSPIGIGNENKKTFLINGQNLIHFYHKFNLK